MNDDKNIFWSFFSSVKLALFLLIILAVASVVGTLIPQNEAPAIYIQQYGERMARLFQILDFSNMYRSWWFVSLLAMLSMNLIICTIDRLPNVWRKVWENNLDIDPGRLEKMPHKKTVVSPIALGEAISQVEAVLKKTGWTPQQTTANEGTLFLAHKGNWTRLGVYFVHISILIIFAGSIIGIVLGYKANVMIPEGATAPSVYQAGSNKPIPLDFQLRCDKFTLSLYDTGAPKEYRSDLTVLEGGKPVLQKSIVVNDPLSYKGITFYQASYQGLPEYRIQLENSGTKAVKTFNLEPRKQVRWQEEGLVFGIVNTSDSGPTTKMVKIWLSDDKGQPESFWITPSAQKKIRRDGKDYTVTFLGQRFATGLQVTKDPGVWFVYGGCTLMLIGFVVAFFLSHQRMWIFVREENGKARILVAGSSNKNKIGFEKKFEQLSDQIQQLSTPSQQ